jgi:hypothetical protein
MQNVLYCAVLQATNHHSVMLSSLLGSIITATVCTTVLQATNHSSAADLSTCCVLQRRAPEWEDLGLLGPIIRGTGCTIPLQTKSTTLTLCAAVRWLLSVAAEACP